MAAKKRKSVMPFYIVAKGPNDKKYMRSVLNLDEGSGFISRDAALKAMNDDDTIRTSDVQYAIVERLSQEERTFAQFVTRKEWR